MANIYTGAALVLSFSTASATRWFHLADSDLQVSTSATEAWMQIKCRTPGTASNLRVKVTSNGRSTATTLKFRKNGADGNQNISIGAGLTGLFEDTTNSDTLADGDFYTIQMTTSTGTGSIAFDSVDMKIAVTSGSAKQIHSSGTVSTSSASTTTYQKVAGTCTSTSTDVLSSFPAPVALTLSNFQIYVTANARSTATTFKSRVDAADGNQSISVGAGLTGFFEDASNSDSLTAGQLYNVSRTTGTGGGTITYANPGFKVVTDGSGFLFCVLMNVAASSSLYFPLIGASTGNATEVNVDLPMPFACVASKIALNVTENSSTTNATFKLRDDAADATIAMTIPATTTGVFQDTSHSDSIASGSQMTYSLSGITTGTVTPLSASIFLTEDAGGGSVSSGPIFKGRALGAGRIFGGSALAC